MGYRLYEPVFIVVSKPLLTEFGIHLRLESCGVQTKVRPLQAVYLKYPRTNCRVYFRSLGIDVGAVAPLRVGLMWRRLTFDWTSDHDVSTREKSNTESDALKLASKGTSWAISCGVVPNSTWEIGSLFFPAKFPVTEKDQVLASIIRM